MLTLVAQAAPDAQGVVPYQISNLQDPGYSTRLSCTVPASTYSAGNNFEIDTTDDFDRRLANQLVIFSTLKTFYDYAASNGEIPTTWQTVNITVGGGTTPTEANIGRLSLNTGRLNTTDLLSVNRPRT